MRKPFSLALTLCSLAVLGLVAPAGGFWQQQERGNGLPSIQAEPRSPDRSSFDLPHLVQQFQTLVSVRTTYHAVPSTTQRLKDLQPEGEARRILTSVYSAPLLEGRLLGEGEIAYHSPATNTVEGAGDPQHRMVRLGLTGTEGAFRYGVTYRSAGKGFAGFEDQALREAWGEWQVGLVRVRTSLEERWNNLENDPRRPRLTQVHEKLSLHLAPPSWPALSLSYASGSLSSSLEPMGAMPQRKATETLEAALSHSQSTWSAKVTSTYVLNRDQLRLGFDHVGMVHTLSGSYRPVNGLTITPSLSLREDQQRWSGARVETPSTALALAYASGTRWSLTASGSYSRTQSSDGLIDTQAFSAKGMLTWTLQGSSPIRTTVSFEPAYRSNIDALHRAQSVGDLSGLVRLQLAGF